MTETPGRGSDLLDDAVALARTMPTPGRPSDQWVLDRLLQNETRACRSIPHEFYRRSRQLNPFVRYGIVVLVLSALALIGFGPHSGTLALADVVEAIAKHKTVRFETRHETPPGERPKFDLQALRGGAPRTWTQTSVGTLDRMHVRLEDPQGHVTILDRAKGILLRLDPQQKTALVSKFRGTKTTIGLLELLGELEKDTATISTNEQLDGSSVVVYRLGKKGMKSAIWVDLQSKLPVRAEMEEVGGRREKVTMTQFVWDPLIANPLEFFSVESPPGYTISTTDMFRPTPADKKAKRP
jgi:outer membrane lipoprotein-sorting protein